MHLFEYLGEFGVNLLIPVLRFDQRGRFRQEASANFQDHTILVVTHVLQRLQDASLISSIKGSDRKNAGLSPHAANLVGELAKLVLYLLRIWQEIDRILKGIGAKML